MSRTSNSSRIDCSPLSRVDRVSPSDQRRARGLLESLETALGRFDWWSGDADEVMIGAVLTQQTRWENVEQALDRLRGEGMCTIPAIHLAGEETVQDLIRCTGFFRVKTRRLKNLAGRVVREYGCTGEMARRPTGELREFLLETPGIGEETADSILCYGFSRASFVVDAYTGRICRCAGITTPRKELKSLFESILPRDPVEYRLVHGRFVEYAKGWCARCSSEHCVVTNSPG